jgi:hypothetical protein
MSQRPCNLPKAALGSNDAAQDYRSLVYDDANCSAGFRWFRAREILILSFVARANEYLAEWAKRNHFRIISQRYVLVFRQGWYYIVVEDRSGRKRSGRITFGLFSGKEDVHWDE